MEPFQKVGSSAVLVLAPGDNIAVAVRNIGAGEAFEAGGAPIRIREAVATGHKVAIRRIARDDRVIKYGAPIGRATRDIEPGEYVHIHNVTSDYIPTYTFDEGHQFLQENRR